MLHFHFNRIHTKANEFLASGVAERPRLYQELVLEVVHFEVAKLVARGEMFLMDSDDEEHQGYYEVLAEVLLHVLH